ncbi:uncharacterized protein in mobD 3'region-like [Procambarus clarkii]|uniref:uncharacterized protein in mobD 3'region-like n=1 Tax=Procambarus clarkii TaxID=6728 RepID=UPI003742DA94
MNQLDYLIFTLNESEIKEVKFEAPVGLSAYSVLAFEYLVENSEKTVQDMDYVTQKCQEAADRFISAQNEKNEKQQKNLWLNQACKKANQSSTRTLGNYSNNRTPDSRGSYQRARNEYQLDLSGSALRELDLSGSALRELDLSGSAIRELDLSGSALRDLDLSGSAIRELDLSGSALRELDLSGSALRELDLSGSALRELDLSGSALRELDLSGSALRELDLSGSAIRELELEILLIT